MQKRIDDASAKSLKTIFDQHIGKKCSVTTDKWRGYLPLRKDREIMQVLSKKEATTKMLHVHIMNVKGWLSGIHHKCST